MSVQKWVWVPDTEKAFVKAELMAESDPAQVKLPDGTEKEVPLAQVSKVNPPQFDRANDIAELTYLNEASVVNNLNTRYAHDEIYTYSGLFLVAVNPWKCLPIYDDKVIAEYHRKERNDAKPHIYAVAELAFRQMLDTRENQSILITGESGAGKTENTKRAIQYLSAITSSKTSAGGIDSKIVQTNPILEAFGNAQTGRNNNSSRFGKFIRVEFAKSGAICGAGIEWYLLEKSRVIVQAREERNYHIFYQLLSGAPSDLKRRLQIELSATPADFNYLNKSSPVIEGVSDADHFRKLVAALLSVGMSTSNVDNLFVLVAAVLHLGNVEIKAESSDQGRISNPEQVKRVCSLLGIPADDFIKALLKPKVKAGREWVIQARSAAQGRAALDALSKSLYERLFGHVVDQLNIMLKNSDNTEERTSFIGVLDIAGFEIFQRNSFEQLCINYTNEKLQQFFNHHMFVLEQEEYVREEIEWDYVDFAADLQPTIDLIEKANPMGIFSCLDEDCVMPRATDASFTEKLATKWTNKNSKFKPARLNQGFVVSHYASPVEYDTQGWLEKNKDPVSEPIVDLLATSENNLVKTLFTRVVPTATTQQHGRKGIFRTVAQRYKEQLVNLMEQLGSTHPHFVRCIVPNNNKHPRQFDNALVLDQLRCNGVLEGIRIARSGFPNRLDFKDFCQRYLALLPLTLQDSTLDYKSASLAILKHMDLNPASYKVGKSKVFFRNGVLAELESLRDKLIAEQMTKVQAVLRGFLTRRRIQQQIFRERAAESIARSVQTYNKNASDPWWRLLCAMRPLLLSKDSMDNTRKDLRMQKLEETVRQLREDQRQLRATKLELSQEIENMGQARKGAELLAADKEEILKRAQDRISVLEEANSQLEADVVKLENKCSELISSQTLLSEKSTMLNTQLKKAAEIITKLQNERVDPQEYQGVVERNKCLQADNNQLHTDLHLANSKHSAMADECSSLKSNAVALAAQVQKHKDDHRILTRDHQGVSSALSDHKKKLAAAESRAQSLKEQVEAAKNSIAELTRGNDTLKKQIDHVSSESSFLKDLEEKFKEFKLSASREHKEKDATINGLQSDVKKLTDALTDFNTTKQDLVRVRKDLANAQQEANQNKSRGEEVASLQAELSKGAQVQNKLNKSLITIEELTSKLAEADTKAKRVATLEKFEAIAKESQRCLTLVEKELAVAKNEAKLVPDLRAQVAASDKQSAAELRKLQAEHTAAQNQLTELKLALGQSEKRLKSFTLASELRMSEREAKDSKIVNKIQDLEQELATAREDAIASKDRVRQLTSEQQSSGSSYGDVVLLKKQLEKVQREKAAALEENSKLRFGAQNQRRTTMELEVERAKGPEVKKLQSEVKILKLKLLQSEKDRNQAMNRNATPAIVAERDNAVKTLQQLQSKFDNLLAAHTELEGDTVKQNANGRGIEVKKTRDDSQRALRVISGNNRHFSESKSERNLHSKLTTVTEPEYITDLERSLQDEAKRNKELSELLAQFRQRAELYQSRVDTVEVVLNKAKVAETSAKQELHELRSELEEERRHHSKELASTNETLSLLRKELNARDVELHGAKRQLTRTRSTTDQRDANQQALSSQIRNMSMSIDDLTLERDRLLSDKLKLEKRLAHAWMASADNPEHETRERKLQEKLEQAQQNADIQQRMSQELKYTLERQTKTVEQLRASLVKSDERLERQQAALESLQELESSHEIALRKSHRETATAKEEALRHERELEQYKMRYEITTLQRASSRKSQGLAFI